ncbi:MAG TPA: hydrogenase nickel incorporation protein HypB [Clostridia bacterium]|nr:hydrogenase nickel incorporation protein HypB [Clostridia bacterium]
MSAIRVIEIKKGIFEQNDKKAEKIRKELKDKGLFLLNLMSSPGSGKTTTLVSTIEQLKDEMEIGVIEADIDSDVDARTIDKTGVRVIQLHTGGMCHLDAEMTRQGIEALGAEGLDFMVLENIGNLVCPAGFDTGATKNAMIISIPEGHDKPLKYPEMFKVVDVVLVNKIDAMEYFDFDLDLFRDFVHKINPEIEIIPMSAKTGEGIEPWVDWIRKQVAKQKV